MKTKYNAKHGQHSPKFSVSFTDMTKGEVLSLANAIKAHAEVSPVGNDLRIVLAHAIQEWKQVGGLAEFSDDLLQGLGNPD